MQQGVDFGITFSDRVSSLVRTVVVKYRSEQPRQACVWEFYPMAGAGCILKRSGISDRECGARKAREQITFGKPQCGDCASRACSASPIQPRAAHPWL